MNIGFHVCGCGRYKGGIFRFQIWFPNNYPNKPPRLKCLTPVYHCNIDARGTVCLDVEDDLLRLKPSRETEVQELSSTRISAFCLVQALLSLLAAPVPEDGLVADASKLYVSDRQEYNRRAHEWTIKHAF
ncbi:UBE2D1 [Symbiodinium pilosum]|uniref:UBE2D1 protein n=1 Tax=Symbiodinium pilosum TaxID=2952 RepID=A0A812IRL7_SYMPI|nr:UBE2D1 [Symbiodinium pilosum]